MQFIWQETTTDTSHYENVPEGWCSCLLGEICQIQSSKRVHKNDYVEKGVPFYRTTEIKELSEGKAISNCLFISDTQYSFIKEKYGVPHKGDILISAVGTIGITYVIPNEDSFYFKDGNLIWIEKSECVNSDYLCMMLGHMVRNSNAISTSGSAYNALTIEKLTELEILLPPLTEQNRIIEELNKWYSSIEIIESGEAYLSDTIQLVKSKILDLAIHGKLVPQDENDEPASELLKRINPKAVASCDNPHYAEPYELPHGWKWVELGKLSIDSADGPFGSNLKKEHYTSEKEVRIIQLSNIGEDGWRDENTKYTTFEHLSAISRSEVKSGDVVIAKMMPAGRAILCPNSDLKYVLSSDAVKFVLPDGICNEYILNAINSSVFREQVYDNVQGVTRVRTSLQKLRTYLVPIPPIKEQLRIVSKVNELFSQLDMIEKSLQA